MINLNKYRLVPDREIGGLAAWGSIVGDINKQEDLMSVLSSYATESWVSSNHFATQTWVSSHFLPSTALTGYATESWVSSQGYLTEHQPLKTVNNQSLVGTGNINIEAVVPDYYATKQWVSDQGYLTSETLPSDIATEEWVSSHFLPSTALTGYATESWVSSQGYLTSVSTTITEIDSRLSSIETTLGQAVTITNNILS